MTIICTLCQPRTRYPDWIALTEHIKRDHPAMVGGEKI